MFRLRFFNTGIEDKRVRRVYYMIAVTLIYLFSLIVYYGLTCTPLYKLIMLNHGTSSGKRLLIYLGMRFISFVVSIIFHRFLFKKQLDLKLIAYTLSKVQQEEEAKKISPEERQRLEDQRILRENRLLEDERLRKEKTDRIDENKAYQQNAYEIISITPMNQPFVFLLKFSNKYEIDAPPVIKIDTLPVSTAPVSSSPYECTCQVEKLAFSNHLDGNIIFYSGKYECAMINPYKMKATAEPIIWQCEGRADEKFIFLPQSYFPHLDQKVVYPFDILINNRLVCSVEGIYNTTCGKIVVPLGGGISKSDFIGSGSDVILRYSVGGTQKIVLPKPCVVFRNGKPVGELAI